MATSTINTIIICVTVIILDKLGYQNRQKKKRRNARLHRKTTIEKDN